MNRCDKIIEKFENINESLDEYESPSKAYYKLVRNFIARNQKSNKVGRYRLGVALDKINHNQNGGNLIQAIDDDVLKEKLKKIEKNFDNTAHKDIYSVEDYIKSILFDGKNTESMDEAGNGFGEDATEIIEKFSEEIINNLSKELNEMKKKLYNEVNILARYDISASGAVSGIVSEVEKKFKKKIKIWKSVIK